MATTVGNVIARALRLIRAVDANESPEALDIATSIEALNAMVRRWEANGLALGWSPVSNPSDALPAPDEAEEAIVYQLAIRIAPEYGKVPNPLVMEGAKDFLSMLLRDQAVATPMRPILYAPVPSGSYLRGGGFRSSVWDF